MRIDLHNHTATALPESSFSRLKRLEKNSDREIYLQVIKYHHLDALAITNHHNIEIAVKLAREYPRHVIVGAEYRVTGEEGSSIQVAVLGVESELHETLLRARLRGVAHFTSLIRERQLPFYLAHVGWGIDPDHPRSAELLDSFLSYFDAIEVADASTTQPNFAMGLASYYQLAPIGGSGHLISVENRRAYTESSTANNIEEFFADIKKKQVGVGFTTGVSASPSGFSSIWKWGKNFYRREMQRLWHSEFGLGRQVNVGALFRNFGQVVLAPTLQWLPQATHLQQIKSAYHKLAILEAKFVNYLELKETRRIFKLACSIDEKKEMWKTAITRIHDCFKP